MHNKTIVSFTDFRNKRDLPITFFKFSEIGVCCSRETNGYHTKPMFPQQGDEMASSREANDAEAKESSFLVPTERGCGLSTKSYSKIVVGRPTEPNEWPWMAGK